ncbi:MAG: hemolysin family protein [Thermoplasmatota archaeon]
MDILFLTGELLLALLFIGLNGFFVAAEFAIVKVRGTQLAESARGGDAGSKRAQSIVAHVDEYLAACQLGITLASLALGWVGAPALGELLVPIFSLLGILSPAAQVSIAFLVGFAILTALHVILGEQAPKYYALKRPAETASDISLALVIFVKIFGPVVRTLSRASRAMLRLFGIREVAHESKHTEEELRLLLTSAVSSDAAAMMLGVFDLKHLASRDVMTPRNRIVALDMSRPFEENLRIAEETGYSRFPLLEGNLDQVTGMVHYRDLMQLARSATAPKDLHGVRREVLFVPEGRPAEDVLRDLLRRGRHMAIVLDEFGTTVGLLTLEDIFEELFGEIRDEFDVAEAEQPWRKLGEGHFLIDAQVPLHQAQDVLGTEFDNPAGVSTLGGYVIAEVGRLPAKGERMRIGSYEAIVREADRKRLKLLELWKPTAPKATDSVEDLRGRPSRARAKGGTK